MSIRKTPVRHPVAGHNRDGRYVNAYWRGKGTPPSRTRRVVGDTKPFIQISKPVVADVIKTKVISSDYDYDEKVQRATLFRVTLVTSDAVLGHENEEWLAAFVKMFPTLDNSLREGYTVSDVMVLNDAYDWDKWQVTLELKKGVPDIDTDEVETAVVERIARSTQIETDVGEEDIM